MLERQRKSHNVHLNNTQSTLRLQAETKVSTDTTFENEENDIQKLARVISTSQTNTIIPLATTEKHSYQAHLERIA